MWQRWNQSTHIFEKSDNDGVTWVALPLSAAILTEGTVAAARLGSGTPDSTKFLRGDSSWQSVSTQAFPVGSIFIAAVSTNPNTLLGYGTWSQYAQGRVLVGFSSGDGDFGTLEGTGGAKTHTLTTAQMPSHGHTINDPQHYHGVPTQGAMGDGGYIGRGTVYNGYAINSNGASTGITINAAGSDGAHNNIQPYITVYMWKRTA